jgi:uncharacterized Zn finger protein
MENDEEYQDNEPRRGGLGCCPVCGALYFKYVRQTDDYLVVRCPECGEMLTISLFTSAVRLYISGQC